MIHFTAKYNKCTHSENISILIEIWCYKRKKFGKAIIIAGIKFNATCVTLKQISAPPYMLLLLILKVYGRGYTADLTLTIMSSSKGILYINCI